MALNTSQVSKSLDRKLKIAGFEIPDLLAIFLLLSILNFIFGSSPYKIFLSWIPSVIFALVLRIGKRGKPDNYLVHLGKFMARPKYLSAFVAPTNNPIIKRTKKREE